MKIMLSRGEAEEGGHKADKKENEDMQGRDMKRRISRGGVVREHTREEREEKDTQIKKEPQKTATKIRLSREGAEGEQRRRRMFRGGAKGE